MVAGVAFHGTAAYVNPMGEYPLSDETGWAFLQWGWLRLLAWAGIAGGVWLLAREWSGRAEQDVPLDD